MRCLIVEDEAETARWICTGLKEAGFTVVCCRHSVGGLHLAAGECWDGVILAPCYRARSTDSRWSRPFGRLARRRLS